MSVSDSAKIRNAYKCNVRITIADTTTITDADTYYSLAGTFSDGLCKGFTVASDGTITYNGPTRRFLFVGASDLEVDKACTITYAMEVDGFIDETITTPHTFGYIDNTDNIAITRILTLNTGNVLKIKAKSSASATELIANTLYLTFMEE